MIDTLRFQREIVVVFVVPFSLSNAKNLLVIM